MKNCQKCEQKKIVFKKPDYCKEHFQEYIENKVENTIQEYNLVQENEEIAVAVSGGKDSQTVLYILSQLYPEQVKGIAIDEGIDNYRDQTLEDIQEFCNQRNIPLDIHSFEEDFGLTTDKIVEQGMHSCRNCGVLRRKLLNKYAKGYDKIATGHNLDDECQNFLMNLMKGNLSLCARLGPSTGIKKQEGLVQRIKPLYKCTEKEIATYAYIKGFPVDFDECPHMKKSFRQKIRDKINEIEKQKPNTKKNIVEYFLQKIPKLEQELKNDNEETELRKCKKCGSPSSNPVCRSCKTLENYQQKTQQGT